MDERELKVYVGKRIREERKRKKITQKELGDLIGVKHNTISSYEKGTTAPEQNTIFKIANALNVRVDDLFPDKEHDQLQRALNLTDGLELHEIEFLNEIIEETLSKKGEEREKFLERLKFTVDYEKNN